MALSREEIQEIAVKTADGVIEKLEKVREEITTRDLLIGTVIGEGAIPVHGRENRKEPCRGCRIDPSGPLEASNIMATTKDAIGTLSPDEVRNWCSEIEETPDGRCQRAIAIRKAAQECKEKFPDDTKGYFDCFIPKFRTVSAKAS